MIQNRKEMCHGKSTNEAKKTKETQNNISWFQNFGVTLYKLYPYWFLTCIGTECPTDRWKLGYDFVISSSDFHPGM